MAHLIEPVWAVIESRRTAMRMATRELARRTGLRPDTLRSGANGSQDTKWRTILLLVKALDGKIYVTFQPVSGNGGTMALELTADSDLDKILEANRTKV